MYLINGTYFQGDRLIPNLNEADSISLRDLERIIDYRCRLFLRELLGNEDFADFDSYLVNGYLPIAPEEPTPDPVPLKWRQLVEGASYEVNEVPVMWKGLVWSDGTFKGSLLADYVYYYWLLEQASIMTGVGEAKPQAKGAQLVNPTQRIVTTWNRFVEAYQGYDNGYWDYWRGRPCLYDHYTYNASDIVSFVEFLAHNQENYPNVSYRRYAVKNQLGL